MGTSLMLDKVVLITGGTKGIGKTIAQYMAKEGAHTVVTSRNPTALFIENEWPNPIRVCSLDVTQEESVTECFRMIDRLYGKIDILVNNAGIGYFRAIEETTLQEWEDVLRTNLTGTFLCSREAYKRMKLQGGGRIINLSSVAGYIPIVENGAYGTSKWAVGGFSKILNEEGKSDNIRVSVVYPGAVYTDIWDEREQFDSSDMLKPEDVAETVLDIARRPLHVRIDEVKILPSKGVL